VEVFRISAEKYATHLTASGSANRWNKRKQFVIYTAASRSLASLELVVHRASIQPALSYKIMIIYLPDEEALYQQISINELSENWRTISAYPNLQNIGSNWYEKKESLILKIPSVIIPKEYNYIINTKHSDFTKVKLINVEDYFWDARLL